MSSVHMALYHTAVSKTVTTVFLRDIVLILLLYIVWHCNRKICVTPIIVELARIGLVYTANVLVRWPSAHIYISTLSAIGPVRWVLDLAVNFSVTAARTGGLRWMGCKVQSISSWGQVGNRYMVSMLAIVGSGALFTAAAVTNVTLASDNLTHLVVLTLHIIVGVGLGLTHSLPKAGIVQRDNLAQSGIVQSDTIQRDVESDNK
ncbi:hypothetical protein FA95DRAFT_1612491 [Auriscalpium vulgare]|uniref:Uncharacterized protein n=1 Tax=Auriscalpium vulgare TaxID=40419 RepID=A0ACB8R617_9AGAM|nr:hypothetical protein FA95DRAFT_1612491 [Auriscalpium vulgare]